MIPDFGKILCQRVDGSREIKRKFNPPGASNIGGVWGRMIQIAKQV